MPGFRCRPSFGVGEPGGGAFCSASSAAAAAPALSPDSQQRSRRAQGPGIQDSALHFCDRHQKRRRKLARGSPEDSRKVEACTMDALVDAWWESGCPTAHDEDQLEDDKRSETEEERGKDEGAEEECEEEAEEEEEDRGWQCQGSDERVVGAEEDEAAQFDDYDIFGSSSTDLTSISHNNSFKLTRMPTPTILQEGNGSAAQSQLNDRKDKLWRWACKHLALSSSPASSSRESQLHQPERLAWGLRGRLEGRAHPSCEPSDEDQPDSDETVRVADLETAGCSGGITEESDSRTVVEAIGSPAPEKSRPTAALQQSQLEEHWRHQDDQGDQGNGSEERHGEPKVEAGKRKRRRGRGSKKKSSKVNAESVGSCARDVCGQLSATSGSVTSSSDSLCVGTPPPLVSSRVPSAAVSLRPPAPMWSPLPSLHCSKAPRLTHTRTIQSLSGQSLHVTVTNQASVVDGWMKRHARGGASARSSALPSNGRVRHEQEEEAFLLGLDAEWKPTWRKGGKRNPVALLQLSTASHCLIVQMLFLDQTPCSLHLLMQSPDVVVCGVGVGEDVAKLRADHGLGWGQQQRDGECWRAASSAEDDGAGEIGLLELGQLAAHVLKCSSSAGSNGVCGSQSSGRGGGQCEGFADPVQDQQQQQQHQHQQQQQVGKKRKRHEQQGLEGHVAVVKMSLGRLCQSVLGEPMDKSKSVRLSNWAVPRLTDRQVEYAATDAWISYRIAATLLCSEKGPHAAASAAAAAVVV